MDVEKVVDPNRKEFLASEISPHEPVQHPGGQASTVRIEKARHGNVAGLRTEKARHGNVAGLMG
eukprot:11454594-Karenia_brevis.AAC.1